jgi:hypothetical protein
MITKVQEDAGNFLININEALGSCWGHATRAKRIRKAATPRMAYRKYLIEGLLLAGF